MALRESLGAVPDDFLADREQGSEAHDPFADLPADMLSADDPAETLTSEDAIEVFLADAAAIGDAGCLEHARAVADRARATIKAKTTGGKRA